MKILTLLSLAIVLISCSTETSEIKKKEKKVDDVKTEKVDKKSLVEIKGHTYTEYYEDRKSIKFQGQQDDNKQRHGKWSYYSITGEELSTTMYSHGKRHGHIVVKYPNGMVNYVGEYDQNERSGIWKFYDRSGKLSKELDYSK
jgi:antitoxin component YwqK of YwqJK toxin-antitoxin module